MNLGRSLLCLAAFALTAFALVIHLRGRGSAVLAQAGNAVELEDTLFIVDKDATYYDLQLNEDEVKRVWPAKPA